ncbi:hypothetical protein BBP40_000207, partial [Aspergillus hancockii]
MTGGRRVGLRATTSSRSDGGAGDSRFDGADFAASQLLISNEQALATRRGTEAMKGGRTE